MMRFYWIFAGIALLTTAAWADPARDVLKEVAKCADIAAAADRLKCFDAAVPGAQTALATPEPAPMQTAETEESGGVLSWFGLERPVRKPADFGKPSIPVASAHEVTSISAGVLEFAKNTYGRSIFVLDNGQVWKQIDGDTTELRDPRKGEPMMKVTIELGMLGGYNLTVAGVNGMVKVRRVK